MSDFEYTEKNLYKLLFILCDMLSSEKIANHEEIICKFIRTIELEGKPLKPCIQVMLKHEDLGTILENSTMNISYASQKKILNVMREAWPEDTYVINQLHQAAQKIYREAKKHKPAPKPGKTLIQNLLKDS